MDIVLNDARFSMPASWGIDGDEMIEDARRAVRLSDPSTGVALQAVTLPAGTATLTESCVSLVEVQEVQFTAVERQLVVPIGVGETTGTGVRCGFTGTRDGVPSTVSFTLLSRTSDAHMLMLRTTVPDSVPADEGAVLELQTMSCQAGSSFGVALPLC